MTTATKKKVIKPAAKTAAKTPVKTQAKAPAKPAAKTPAKRGFPAKKGFPARKPGARPAAKKKPIPTFKAPADFKPHFLLVSFVTEKDGLVGSGIKATRYQGRFDRDVEDKKKFDLGAYDPKTLTGIAARLSAVTFKATNDKKFSTNPSERADQKGGHRLPASTQFQILMRVGKKAADQSLTAGIKQVWQVAQNAKTGRMGVKALEKTDPAYRMIRRASRFLPAAFKEVLLPPKRTRRQADEE